MKKELLVFCLVLLVSLFSLFVLFQDTKKPINVLGENTTQNTFIELPPLNDFSQEQAARAEYSRLGLIPENTPLIRDDEKGIWLYKEANK